MTGCGEGQVTSRSLVPLGWGRGVLGRFHLPRGNPSLVTTWPDLEVDALALHNSGSLSVEPVGDQYEPRGGPLGPKVSSPFVSVGQKSE